MELYEDRNAFLDAIAMTANYFSVDPALVEKDYYVTLVLKKLNEKTSGLLFKGGTSLSKCYKIIDRFSEDIDLTLDNEHLTQRSRQCVKKNIVEICNEFGLVLTNEEETKSRKDYNCYNIQFPILFSSLAVNPILKVETVFIQKSYPNELKYINSFIGEWLALIGREDLIRKYELQQFEIRVQTMERTLVDKIFALCDYMLRGEFLRQSRHIYDISRLLTKVQLNTDLKKLIIAVREERKTNKMCVSAQDGMSIPDLLRKIIDTEFFKKDYENNTQKLLSKPMEYEEAVKALDMIIASGIFVN